MTAVTGVVHIPRVEVTKLVAMEQERTRFTVLLQAIEADDVPELLQPVDDVLG